MGYSVTIFNNGYELDGNLHTWLVLTDNEGKETLASFGPDGMNNILSNNSGVVADIGSTYPTNNVSTSITLEVSEENYNKMVDKLNFLREPENIPTYHLTGKDGGWNCVMFSNAILEDADIPILDEQNNPMALDDILLANGGEMGPDYWDYYEVDGLIYQQGKLSSLSCHITPNLPEIRRVSPLVIDLNGDGIQTTSMEGSEAWFDFYQTGYMNHTAWLSPEDGFLVYDANNNGVVDDLSELFGTETSKDSLFGANGAFEQLRQFDSNGDNIISSADESFNSLQIWKDSNSNGLTDEGELYPLDYFGINEISLDYRLINEEQNGNHFVAGSTVNTNNGTAEIKDVFFQVDTMYKYQGQNRDYTLYSDTAQLPNQRGYGYLKDFVHLSSINDDFKYINAVMSTLSVSEAFENFDYLLYYWTEDYLKEHVYPNISTGSSSGGGSAGVPYVYNAIIDFNTMRGDLLARKAALIEGFYGQNITYINSNAQVIEFNSVSAKVLSSLFDKIKIKVFSNYILQTVLSEYITSAHYSYAVDSIKINDMDLFITEINDLTELLEYKDKVLIGLALFDYGFVENGLRDEITNLDSLVSSSYNYFNSLYATDPDSLNLNNLSFGTTDSEIINGSSISDLIYGDSGDDTISAGNGNDSITGGKGNDYIDGGAGADTYMFNLGDGNDIIYDYSSTSSSSSYDTIIFGEGLTVTDMKISKDYNSQTIFIEFNSGDSILFKDWFKSSLNKIESFQFADGTILTAEQIELMGVVYGTDGDDMITGLSINEIIYGGDGDDIIEGGGGDDVLSGGKGNDYLGGASGNDTYLIELGDEIVKIYDPNSLTGVDKVVFGEGLLLSDMKATRNYIDNSIKLEFSTGETVILQRWFNTGTTKSTVESFHFADGTILSAAELEAMSVTYGTEGDDNITLTSGAYMYGLGGNDFLIGSSKDDVIYGGDGDDIIEGGGGDDVLSGGKGNDYLGGASGNDTYLIELGDEIVKIYDPNSLTGVDKVVFGEGLLLSDMKATRNYIDNSIKLEFSTGETVILQRWFNTGTTKSTVESFHFADGTVLTSAELEAISAVYGTDGDDMISGLSINDIIYGGDGDDIIEGGGGDDVLSGGKGNDYLGGASGNDTYLIELGDEIVKIYDPNSLTGVDKVVFGEGLLLSDMKATRNYTDNSIKLEFSTGETVILQRWFNTGTTKSTVESFHFADGTVLTSAELEAISAVYGTDGDDMISGLSINDIIYGGDGDDTINANDGNDTIFGGKGNDYLSGGRGNDTYIFSIGDGQDTIYDYHTSSSTDKIIFGEGLNIQNIVLTKNEQELVIHYSGSDSVKIEKWFTNSYYKIERTEANDGNYLTHNQIDSLIQEMAAYAAAEGVDISSYDAVNNNDHLKSLIVSSWSKDTV